MGPKPGFLDLLREQIAAEQITEDELLYAGLSLLLLALLMAIQGHRHCGFKALELRFRRRKIL